MLCSLCGGSLLREIVARDAGGETGGVFTRAVVHCTGCGLRAHHDDVSKVLATREWITVERTTLPRDGRRGAARCPACPPERAAPGVERSSSPRAQSRK